jgi:hypothetical protein
MDQPCDQGSNSPDDLYETIRRSAADVEAISRQTGWKPQNIQNVKDHLFFAVHWLDLYEDLGVPGEWSRFDSSLEIVASWQRLQSGSYTPNDLQLLRHETAEAWFMRKYGPSYREAHRAAQQRYPWQSD